MKRIKKKQKFIDTYCDPLEGYDLSKKIVILEPSFFVIKRVLFVAACLYMWDQPLVLLLTRLFLSTLEFSRLAATRPHKIPRATKLDLMNEVTNIVLIDCFLVLTDVLTEGNKNDLNQGSAVDLKEQREKIAVIYVSAFIMCVSVHVGLLLSA